MRAAAVLLALLIAAGCVTTGTTPTDVGNFKGQPSQPIVAKLGMPDTEERTASGTVYRWHSEVMQESAPVRTVVTDYSSGLPQQREETRFQPQTQHCTLTLVADGAGNVADFSRDGTLQACAPLLDRLASP